MVFCIVIHLSVLSWLQTAPPLIRQPQGLTPVSLRLGHAAGLTVHRTVIQYRVAASLPKIREKANGLVAKIQLFSEHHFDDYPLLVK